MKQLLAMIMMSLLLSCKNEDKHIDIYYMPEGVLTAMNIDCRWVRLSQYNVKNTTISDEEFVEEFDTYYSELNESDGVYLPDVRIRIFYHHGKETDTICLGEHFGTMVNGQQREDSPKLLKLIKDRIYKK